MANAPHPPHRDPTSKDCRADAPSPNYIHQRHCHAGDGAADLSDFWRHPGQARPRRATDPPPLEDGHTPGFGFGVLLMPYCVDWADRVGIIRRKKAHATIFHSWPRQEDRAFALRHLEDFAAPTDRYAPPFILFLITAKPFAGWRWFAKAALEWLTYAQQHAGTIADAHSLAPPDAITAAAAWASAVRGLWEELTVERFPYALEDVAPYYIRPFDGTPIP